jgi:hypothetical protein
MHGSLPQEVQYVCAALFLTHTKAMQSSDIDDFGVYRGCTGVPVERRSKKVFAEESAVDAMAFLTHVAGEVKLRYRQYLRMPMSVIMDASKG